MTLKQIIALDKECFMNTFGDRVPVASITAVAPRSPRSMGASISIFWPA